MSHLALQHVVVRMLYDPKFMRRVYEEPESATGDCDLVGDERQWLCAGDSRAYQVDPLRRTRSLAGLIEEYAVTCARLLRQVGGDTAKARLDAYFSSANFHEDVQSGIALAPSFGAWLEAEAADHPAWSSTLALEAAICRARRSREREDSATSEPIESLQGARVRTAPGIEILLAPEGTASDFGTCLQRLHAHPAGLRDAILDASLSLGAPRLGPEPEGILVLGHQGELRLETASVEIAKILRACVDEPSFGQLVERSAPLGADTEDIEGLVRSFASDGILLVRP
jgi:hypothetical protein